jgi:diketogulonate reductase-like aldo/keto reductase
LERQLIGSQAAIQELVDIAAKYDAEPVQIALSWLINNQGESVVAILGTSRVKHVHEGIRVMMISLTAEKTARLN